MEYSRASYKHNVSKLCISDESNYSSSSTSNKRNKGSKLSYLYYALVGIRPKILLPYKHHVGVSVICSALQICIRTNTTKERRSYSMMKRSPLKFNLVYIVQWLDEKSCLYSKVETWYAFLCFWDTDTKLYFTAFHKIVYQSPWKMSATE